MQNRTTKTARSFRPFFSGLLLLLLYSSILIGVWISRTFFVRGEKTREVQLWQEQGMDLIKKIQSAHTDEQIIGMYASSFKRTLQDYLQNSRERELTADSVYFSLKTNIPKWLPLRAAYLFTPAGEGYQLEMMKGPGLSSSFQKHFTSLFSSILKLHDDTTRTGAVKKNDENNFRSVFGYLTPIDIFATDYTGIPSPAIFQRQSAYIVWDVIKNEGAIKGVFFFVFERKPLRSTTEGFKYLSRSWDRDDYFPVFIRQLPSRISRDNLYMHSRIARDPVLKNALKYIVLAGRKIPPRKAIDRGEYRLISDILSFGNPYKVILVSKTSNRRSYWEGAGYSLLNCLLLGFAFLFTARVAIFRSLPAISIRTILLLMFTMMGLIPLWAAMGFGLQHNRVISGKLEREQSRLLLDQLERMESSNERIFDNFEELSQWAVRYWIDQVAEGMDFNQILTRIEEYFKKEILLQEANILQVFLPGGEPVSRFGTGIEDRIRKSFLKHFTIWMKSVFYELTFDGGRASLLETMNAFEKMLIEQMKVMQMFVEKSMAYSIALQNGKLVHFILNGKNFLRINHIIGWENRARQILLFSFQIDEIITSRLKVKLGELNCREENRRYALVRNNNGEIEPEYPLKNDHFWYRQEGKTLLALFNQSGMLNANLSRTVEDKLYAVIPGKTTKSIMMGAILDLAPKYSEIAVKNIVLIIACSVLTLLIVILIGWFYRIFLNPVREIRQSLDGVCAGDLSRRVGIPGTDELAAMTQTFDEMIRGLQTRKNLARFVSGSLDQMIENISEECTEKSESGEGVVLVSDIRSFTAITESHSPYQVVAMLNRHLDEMAQIITSCGGLVDKFVGDAIIGIFWNRNDMTACVDDALRAASAMMARHDSIQKERSSQGLFTYKIGIGLDYGRMLNLTIGAESRLEHQVFGSPVTVAEQMEQLSKESSITGIICSPEIAAVSARFIFEPLQFRHVFELVAFREKSG